MMSMNQNERDNQRKLRILRHAEQIGDVCKTCRVFWHRPRELLSLESSPATAWGGRPGKSQTRCPCRKSDPTVFMMESAEDGLCNDLTKPMDWARKRRILSQSEMRPELVVIGSISLENCAASRGMKPGSPA